MAVLLRYRQMLQRTLQGAPHSYTEVNTISGTTATNVWIGSRTGLLKSVDLVKKIATNHYEDKHYGKENGILCMCWKNKDKNSVFTGHNNGIVRHFSVESSSFDGKAVSAPNIPVAETGTLCSIRIIDDSLITASTKGSFCVWKRDDVLNQVTVQTGTNYYIHKIQ